MATQSDHASQQAPNQIKSELKTLVDVRVAMIRSILRPSDVLHYVL